MSDLELMAKRHAIRKYSERVVESDKIESLEMLIRECNAKSGLSIQMIINEGGPLNGIKALGRFKNAINYFAIVGAADEASQEKAGYYGEMIVLEATKLGLGTCWVTQTYSKRKCDIKLGHNEVLYAIIPFGYCEQSIKGHKSKTIDELSEVVGEIPEWFDKGMRAVQMAPTAMNQQKFTISLKGDVVTASAHKGKGTILDLGIVKYHFELGAGIENFKWN